MKRSNGKPKLEEHNFKYLGSGVLYECTKCGFVADMFNFPSKKQKCPGKKE